MEELYLVSHTVSEELQKELQDELWMDPTQWFKEQHEKLTARGWEQVWISSTDAKYTNRFNVIVELSPLCTETRVVVIYRGNELGTGRTLEQAFNAASRSVTELLDSLRDVVRTLTAPT